MRKLYPLVLAVVLLVGFVASPVYISYATSGSMAPVIHEGDGFVVVPTDDVESGEIVTFYAPAEGGFVTHRVVRETPDGFVTKGDANPSTDQAGGLSLVTHDQIRGEVLTVGGKPLTLSGVGPAARFLHQNRFVILGVLALVAVLGSLRSRRGIGRPVREVYRARDLLIPVLLGCVVISSVFVMGNAQHHDLEYVATEDGTGATLAVGEETIRTYSVRVVTSPLTAVEFAADGVRVVGKKVVSARTLAPFGVHGFLRQRTVKLRVRVPPAKSTGPVEGTLSVYPYPGVLPDALRDALRAIHPVVATLVAVFVVYVPVGVLALLGLDRRQRIRTPRLRRLRRYLD